MDDQRAGRSGLSLPGRNEELPVSTRIFVDLPVRDLAAARACCRALGYRINPDFSNAAAACIVVGESIAVMRLAYPFFRTFTEAGAAP